MKYLIFDIECCDGKHICEFGYVLADEQFNVIEQKEILINPNMPFNLTGRPHQKDLYLHYSDEVYYAGKEFPEYYNEIKGLIEQEDQIIVGHSIINDAKFLNTACERYNLESINFKCADSQRMLNEIFDNNHAVSLEDAGVIFDIKKPEYLHKADDDAKTTMELISNMCKSLECALTDLIDLCPSCSGENKDFKYRYLEDKTLYEKMISCKVDRIFGLNKRMFTKFLEISNKPQKQINSLLTGKAVCISLNYELEHFREMMALIQLINKHGATYERKATHSNVFVTWECKQDNGEDRFCSRKKYVEEWNEKGTNIKIISFEELLDLLKTTDDEITNAPFPDESYFINKNKNRKKETASTNIGEQFGELLKNIKLE